MSRPPHRSPQAETHYRLPRETFGMLRIRRFSLTLLCGPCRSRTTINLVERPDLAEVEVRSVDFACPRCSRICHYELQPPHQTKKRLLHEQAIGCRGPADYPNPHWYTVRKIHAYFEGEFVKRNLARSAVAAEIGPHRSCCRSIDEETRALLLASLPQVGPLYALEKEGGFKRGDERGIAFATTRLAAGATAVRDMIVEAWLDSANTPVGYPMVNVRDIESGKVRATRELFGAD